MFILLVPVTSMDTWVSLVVSALRPLLLRRHRESPLCSFFVFISSTDTWVLVAVLPPSSSDPCLDIWVAVVVPLIAPYFAVADIRMQA